MTLHLRKQLYVRAQNTHCICIRQCEVTTNINVPSWLRGSMPSSLCARAGGLGSNSVSTACQVWDVKQVVYPPWALFSSVNWG